MSTDAVANRIVIRRETDADRRAIWHVNQAAFGTDAEANLVDALRAGGFSRISLVADLADTIVGHILFSRLPIQTPSEMIEAVSLAPMAVLPEYQRQQIGSHLVSAGLEACRADGHAIVLVLGHPRFYPRFGFSADLTRTLASPFGGGDAWMAAELKPGALSAVVGRVEYPPPFTAFE